MHRAVICTEAEWIEEFKELDAFWRHDGNPARPHALLTAKPDGKDHSDGFFNWGAVAQYPLTTSKVAHDLALLIDEQGMPSEFDAIQRVVGPGYGAITLADRLAEECGMLSGHVVKSGFTQPAGADLMVTRLVDQRDRVLMCDDTVTSGGSVIRSIQAIERAGGLILSYVVCVCNRSALTRIDDRPILALITVPMNNWTKEECPLCKLGSEAIRPKVPKENWLRLMAAYS